MSPLGGSKTTSGSSPGSCQSCKANVTVRIVVGQANATFVPAPRFSFRRLAPPRLRRPPSPRKRLRRDGVLVSIQAARRARMADEPYSFAVFACGSAISTQKARISRGWPRRRRARLRSPARAASFAGARRRLRRRRRSKLRRRMRSGACEGGATASIARAPAAGRPRAATGQIFRTPEIYPAPTGKASAEAHEIHIFSMIYRRTPAP